MAIGRFVQIHTEYKDSLFGIEIFSKIDLCFRHKREETGIWI